MIDLITNYPLFFVWITHITIYFIGYSVGNMNVKKYKRLIELYKQHIKILENK